MYRSDLLSSRRACVPQEESRMLLPEGQKREFCGTCHATALVLPVYSQRLRRGCNSQQPLGTPAWALWAFLQHESHPYTKVHWFIMLRHVPLPTGRFRIHMPAVWVPIWNLPSPRCCFPVLTLSLQWRHILFWSPTCQGFGYSVSALCSVEFS